MYKWMLTGILFGLSWAWVNPIQAQVAYPMLMSLKPAAAQRGTVSEHQLFSRYDMSDAFRVLVSGEGVTGEVVLPEATDDGAKKAIQEVTLRFHVAADAMAGVRDFRIATPRGVSTLGQLVITDQQVELESGKNDTPEVANEVAVPSTICGAIEKAEDVDYYKFHVEAGESLCFHVQSMRLQDRIHDLQQHVDPILTLRNASGGTLAASDNYFRGDPFIQHRFDQAGDYLLEIRDVRYQGNRYWEYCVEVTPHPFVVTTFPLAVRATEQSFVESVGFQLPDKSDALPLERLSSELGIQTVRLGANDLLANPIQLWVTDLELITESTDAKSKIESAQKVAIPSGINGRLDSPGEVDYYSFEAKKGEAWSFEVIARRLTSMIDSHLRILNADGRQLSLNDDLRLGKRGSSDSWVENWVAPADGVYLIEIRDLQLRGGPEFSYFIQATRSEPYFELYADTDKTQLTPGTSGVLFVRAVRKNGFQGEIQLVVEGLPEGVEAACGKILAGKGQDGTIVLHASANAMPDISNIRVYGTSVLSEDGGDSASIRSEAIYYQEIYQPGGGRGHWPSSMHSVNIGSTADILDVKVSTTEVTLTPGESVILDVEIVRAEGFDKNVTLDVLFKHLNSVYGDSLPEGVTIDGNGSNTLLTNGATEGKIKLVAAKNAPAAKQQQIAIMANVSLNFVMKATYSSRPISITVQP
jgi:hypothetical protein